MKERADAEILWPTATVVPASAPAGDDPTRAAAEDELRPRWAATAVLLLVAAFTTGALICGLPIGLLAAWALS